MSSNTIGIFIEVIFLIILFVGILALAYVVTRKMALMKQGTLSNKNLHIVEVISIGQNQYIYIVQVGEEYHLFARSKDHITYCNTIDKASLSLDKQEEKAFSTYLNHFKQNKQEQKDEDKQT